MGPRRAIPLHRPTYVDLLGVNGREPFDKASGGKIVNLTTQGNADPNGRLAAYPIPSWPIKISEFAPY